MEAVPVEGFVRPGRDAVQILAAAATAITFSTASVVASGTLPRPTEVECARPPFSKVSTGRTPVSCRDAGLRDQRARAGRRRARLGT